MRTPRANRSESWWPLQGKRLGIALIGLSFPMIMLGWAALGPEPTKIPAATWKMVADGYLVAGILGFPALLSGIWVLLRTTTSKT